MTPEQIAAVFLAVAWFPLALWCRHYDRKHGLR